MRPCDPFSRDPRRRAESDLSARGFHVPAIKNRTCWTPVIVIFSGVLFLSANARSYSYSLIMRPVADGGGTDRPRGFVRRFII
jgi:hypothetical protein